ncbi:cyclomaltodextrin glucanotransferase [Parashewanella spongiae]|uniref:Alpha-amylase n=1 Tax=Parashewanella spongiae TaxID=342950 RepID=A0A3A6U1R1_9GAMM|nr:alpha-amylase family glycosyl hydrolase [Parashewanella spongiae]MCL1079123.1 cyclomaltodextrin glucanotransferase [Parashewanella spongiae]RJY19390.1 cyclomaltodextrin glucanotransferase [Parashewanella spongiae]
MLNKLTLGLFAAVSFTTVAETTEFYGTLHPYASENIYFVITDRFVDGDKSNNYENDSGFDRPLEWPTGEKGNVGFLGGDFKGLLNQADYIKDLGFSSVWTTPIFQNPAEAFTGGHEIKPTGFAMDKGKSGYHGYWGVNFYKLDKHLPSKNLDFQQLNHKLTEKGLKTVLDVVLNHGSPSYTMEKQQPLFGQLFDKNGNLVADHMNLSPQSLKPKIEPLHEFFNQKPDLAQLSDINIENPKVMDYFVEAYIQWLGQGASALRLDTVKHIPAHVWGEFSKRIRKHYPDLFMFGEVYSYNAKEIAKYTYPKYGAMSVLDFPLKQAMDDVFAQQKGFETLAAALYLEDGPYANPYELTTFYDNHDMARINATDNGFIDAHNWLFTARGIPVLYYGSEIGFNRGKPEHFGNRNYFGVENIEKAKNHVIAKNLTRIAKIRLNNIALQRGIQIPIEMKGDRAAFYRVFQHDGLYQTALVFLNKSDSSLEFTIPSDIQDGKWFDVITKNELPFTSGKKVRVNAHDVKVFTISDKLTNHMLLQKLKHAMEHRLGGLK